MLMKLTKKNLQQKKVRERYDIMRPILDEKQRRLFLATEAKSLGHVGITTVCIATGVSRKTITNGMKDLTDLDFCTSDRIRKAGGGRKSKIEEYSDLIKEIEKRVESSTYGDPESTMRWCAKSIRHIAADLVENSYIISSTVVLKILNQMGYSLQANKETLGDASHPDRNT